MKHLLSTALCALTLACASLPARTGDFSKHADAKLFIDEMVREHGMEHTYVSGLIDAAVRKQSILDAISRPAEAKPWHQYRPIFLTESRIAQGVQFWNEHEEILADASRHFGVDPEFIVAIIGVETRYGRHAGSYRVLDALATLAFGYPKRAAFFRKELGEFLLLAREEQVEVDGALGSYAGAMGYGQFIPSSYRAYAVDFDDDGRRDLWNSPRDIIGSVANYLKVHGWRLGEPVAVRARVSGDAHKPLLEKGSKPHTDLDALSRLGVAPNVSVDRALPLSLIALEQPDGPEYWIGFQNFYVITRYNRSQLYAMAVTQLASAIAEQRAREQETN